MIGDAQGRHIETPDGDWNIRGPRGAWEYAGEKRGGFYCSCNGTWRFTVG
ncbi:hypothetical protein [Nocardia sp. NPDC051832]